MKEHIRPKKVIQALLWLLNNSKAYQAEGIELSEKWEVEIENVVSTSEAEMFEIETEAEGEVPVVSLKINRATGEWENMNPSPEEEVDSDEDWTEMVEEEGDTGVSETVTMPQSMVADVALLKDVANPKVLQQFEKEFAPLLHNLGDPKVLQQMEYHLAPGEGNRPLSLYFDNRVLTLAFPTVFAGEDVVLPKNISFSEFAKWLMMNVNPNPRLNLELLFYLMKRLQLESAVNQINIAFKKMKGNKQTGIPSVHQLLTGSFIQDSVFKVRVQFNWDFLFLNIFFL